MPEQPLIRPKLLSYREVAKLLDVCERTVATICKRGELRTVRVGSSVRIDPADLEAFIEFSKEGGAR